MIFNQTKKQQHLFLNKKVLLFFYSSLVNVNSFLFFWWSKSCIVICVLSDRIKWYSWSSPLLANTMFFLEEFVAICAFFNTIRSLQVIVQERQFLLFVLKVYCSCLPSHAPFSQTALFAVCVLIKMSSPILQMIPAPRTSLFWFIVSALNCRQSLYSPVSSWSNILFNWWALLDKQWFPAFTHILFYSIKELYFRWTKSS